jgi:hypothetical protein
MLHVLTYGAGDISRFEHLKASAELCNLHIEYITETVWTGFFGKLKAIMKTIKYIADDDIICVIDGYDMLANAGSDEIVRKFKEYNCDILFGSELNCWPGEYLSRYPDLGVKTGYKYVNGGGFMGYAHALKKYYTWKTIDIVEEICKNGTDQAYMAEFVFAHYKTGKYKLDSEVKIFQK